MAAGDTNGFGQTGRLNGRVRARIGLPGCLLKRLAEQSGLSGSRWSFRCGRRDSGREGVLAIGHSLGNDECGAPEIGKVGHLFKIVVVLELLERSGLLLNGTDGIIGQVFDSDGGLLQTLKSRAVLHGKQFAEAATFAGIEFLERGACFLVVTFDGGEGVVGNALGDGRYRTPGRKP